MVDQVKIWRNMDDKPGKNEQGYKLEKKSLTFDQL